MSIDHEQQKKLWDKEHKDPFALKQMDSRKISGSILPFIEFLEEQGGRELIGVEMGCGKGRNVIGLAQEKIISKMYGFDFSAVAIDEAKNRAVEEASTDKTDFRVMDATHTWEYSPDFFDFGIDCTASTDIEDPQGRSLAVKEMHRVLKQKGYLLVYVMSTDDEYHKIMLERSPAEEKNAFYHPDTGKFEKIFSEGELDEMYKNFRLIEARRIEKTTEFFGESYHCKHHWRIYQKP